MPKINIDAATLRDRLVYPEPHRSVTKGYEKRRVGDAAGLTQFGVNRVVLAPDAHTALRHWHEVQDEFVIVFWIEQDHVFSKFILSSLIRKTSRY